MKQLINDYFDLKCHIDDKTCQFNSIYSKYLHNVYLEYTREFGKIEKYDKFGFRFIIVKGLTIIITTENGSYLAKDVAKKFYNYIMERHYSIISESQEIQTIFQLMRQLEYVKQKIKLHETNEIYTELYNYYVKTLLQNLSSNCKLITNVINESSLNDEDKLQCINSYHAGLLNDLFLFGDQVIEYDADNILQFKNNVFTIIVKPYNTNGRYTGTRLPKYLILINTTCDSKKVISFDSDDEKGRMYETIVDFLYGSYCDIIDQ
jgi:hypothetical protein